MENLLDEYEVAWCSPVRLEFMGGARKEERSKLAFWFESIPFRTVEEKHWEAAMRNAWKLVERGHTLPWNDILIASLALDLNMRVYAKDEHFDILSQVLGLPLYKPGYGGSYAPPE